jgi:hypothetical protein
LETTPDVTAGIGSGPSRTPLSLPNTSVDHTRSALASTVVILSAVYKVVALMTGADYIC